MRILVADDDPASRKLLMRILTAWGYEPVGAETGAEAAAILENDGAPPIALLDWEMPGKSGPEVCRDLRASARGRYPYLLLLTGRDGRQDVIDGLDAGADDYLVKPVDPRELRVRLRAGRRIVELQDALIAARDELEHRATHDALTGIWNRAGLLERLSAELARALRDGRPLAVALLDIDLFKRVNDTHGHGAGDDVLREVGARVASVVRPYDLVGRYGGEELLVVLPGACARDAAIIAERVRASIAETPFSTRAAELVVTASVGVAALVPGSTENVEALIARADAALYTAKREGRNRTVAAPSTDSSPPSCRDVVAHVHERLREVLGDDAGDDIESLVDEYVVSAVHEVQSMRAAARSGDLPGMRRHAHALKGASANFGVLPVAKLAAELERADPPTVEAIDRLDALVVHVTRELRPVP